MATHNTVQVAPDASGPLVDFTVLPSGRYRQTMALSNPTIDDSDAQITNAEPAASDWAVVVRAVRAARSIKHFVAAATNNATSLKATAGAVYRVHIYSAAAYPVYVKFYNKASAPAPASDSALLLFTVGCQTTMPRDFLIDDGGAAFSTGIAYAVVKGIADNDNTTVALNDCSVEIAWL